MKKSILPFLLIALFTIQGFAQNPTDDQQMNDAEIGKVFSQEILEKNGVEYPIFRGYKYEDNNGTHYILLTEKAGAPSKTDPQTEAIAAFFFDKKNESVTLKRTVKDFRSDEANKVSSEKSIWFWTKFLRLEDIDNDGIIDPILVYGSTGINKFHDGRIKILTFYSGKEYAIHHQNGTLDHERETKVDKEFYDLPASIQSKVTALMTLIVSKNFAIFPAGWEDAMKNHETEFNER